MGKVDERVVGLVVDAIDHLLLPDQADALLEHLLAVFSEIDVADLDRPGLAAGDRRIRGILEPVALLQPVDDAAVEIGNVAGDALDGRVLDRLDDDVVAEPVDSDLADLIGRGDPIPPTISAAENASVRSMRFLLEVRTRTKRWPCPVRLASRTVAATGRLCRWPVAALERALLGCRLALGRWTWSKAVSPGASRSAAKVGNLRP